MSNGRGDYLPDNAELRNAVLGHSSRLERRVAVALLLHSNYPEREDLLASVATNPRETPQERSSAAIALGHIASSKAELLLTQILDKVPDSVLADAIRSLGRIGGPSALISIDQYLASPARAVADAARFAGALIAHRLGLSGHNLLVPSGDKLLAVRPEESRSIDVTKVSADEAQQILKSLADEAYGIDFGGSTLTQLRCGTDVHTVCLNRRVVAAESTRIVLQHKMLLALVALQSREGDGHSVSYIILSNPSTVRDTIDLLAPRCTGRPALAGSGHVSNSEIRFSLRSIDRPGARALALDGTIADGQLAISQAIVARRRIAAPRPVHS
jgi:hypothetical protein